MNRYFIFFCFTLGLECCILKSNAQKKYDIFYFCVGSEHYEQDRNKYEPGFLGFNQLEAASTSANRMALFFDKLGGVKGFVLNSSKGVFIDRASVLRGVHDLIKSAKQSKSKNPLLVFYYAGHGLSSGQYKTHFIPPGNFVKNYKALDPEGWMEYTIAPLDIREILDETGMSYLMLLDCCYQGEQIEPERISAEVIERTGTEEADTLMGSVFGIFDALFTMTGPDPVVFSCPPGEEVPTTLYDFGEDKMEVAPLCRRAHLIVEEKLQNMDVSLSDFVIMLLDDGLDHRTSAAYSRWVFDSKNLNYILKK